MEENKTNLHFDNEPSKIKFTEDFMKEIFISSSQVEKDYLRSFSQKVLKRFNEEHPDDQIMDCRFLSSKKVNGVSFEDLVTLQADLGISDIHVGRGDFPMFKVENDQVRVGFAYDGDPRFDAPFWKTILSLEDSRILLFDWLSEPQKDKILSNGSVNREFRLLRERTNEKTGEIEKYMQKFRLNIHLEKGGFGVSCRYINASIPKLEDMPIPDVFKTKVNSPSGIIFVCAPTNNGKSYTLSAAIDYINRKKEKHIITVEEPIEVLYEPKKSKITQREVGNDTISYLEGSKDILRMDGNVAVIGEVRYPEELEAAINLATNGLLVFTTTHSTSAYEMMRYVYDMSPTERKNTIMGALMDSMQCVLCQRLHRESVVAIENGQEVEKTKYTTAFEILVNNQKLRAGLRPNEQGRIDFEKVKNNVKSEGKIYGNILMNDHIISLVDSGEMSLKAGLKTSYDPIGLIDSLKEKGKQVDPELAAEYGK